MTKTCSLFALSILFLTLLTTGCGGGEPSVQPPADAASTGGAATETAPTEQVTYEPAYPADVSEEGLREEDVAQQEKHSHDGGEAHSHGEGDEHSDDHGDHAHGEGEGDDHDH